MSQLTLTGAGRSGKVVSGWWLSGGIAAANCLAAYTPKGAASLAASYDNNAAPGNGLADGTYDAAPGVAPNWAAATGWVSNKTKYLDSGIVPPFSQDFTIICRHITDAVVDTSLCGSRSGSDTIWYGLVSNRSNVNTSYYNGRPLYIPGVHVSGVLAVAGNKGYRDGIAEAGTISAPTGAPVQSIWLMGINNSGELLWGLNGSIQAVAIYNTTLSAAQVAAVSAAMAAL